MYSLSRSIEKEYLDNDVIETNELYQNLEELDFINKNLGGYRVSKSGLLEVLKSGKKVSSLLDIGFGGGDSIKQLYRFAEKNNKSIFFYGIDLKRDCVMYAEKNLAVFSRVKLICDDYRNISKEFFKKINIVHCSLFLHHLKDEEIIDLFRLCRENGCIVLVNDLHRNWLAYYSIKIMTALLSKSYLVKNDAPISVLRGFKKKELINLLRNAGFTNYKVEWKWAFRYLIIAYE